MYKGIRIQATVYKTSVFDLIIRFGREISFIVSFHYISIARNIRETAVFVFNHHLHRSFFQSSPSFFRLWGEGPLGPQVLTYSARKDPTAIKKTVKRTNNNNNRGIIYIYRRKKMKTDWRQFPYSIIPCHISTVLYSNSWTVINGRGTRISSTMYYDTLSLVGELG